MQHQRVQYVQYMQYVEILEGCERQTNCTSYERICDMWTLLELLLAA